MNDKLVLSIFCGIDLLGKAFEENKFCVVKAGDKNLDNSDIRNFHAPSGVFNGVIGGSPCQDFSRLNRHPKRYGFEMLEEYQRVVKEASPDWYLFENVSGVPPFQIEGYTEQRFKICLSWFSPFSRLRVFQFGSKNGTLLNPMVKTKDFNQIIGTAVTGNDHRSFQTICEIQGLDKDFDLPFLSLAGKKQAVANAVPMPLGRYMVQLILKDFYQKNVEKNHKKKIYKRCACNCGRVVTGRASYSSPACRKRAQRKRDLHEEF